MRLELRRLGYSYRPSDPEPALEGISFSLEGGQILGLAGPSGAGKSTLLGLLKGFLRPSSGQVLLDGVDIAARKGRGLADRVGLVFQYPERQLFAPSLAEDLAYGLRYLGLSRTEIDRRVDAALDDLGLAPAVYRRRNPLELSGGERRRAALASILILSPDILLLDEPLAGLDAPSRASFLALMEGLAAGGRGVIFVSHEAEDLLLHAPELILLCRGRLLAQGRSEDILGDEALLSACGWTVPPRLALARRLGALGFRGGPRAGPEAMADFIAGRFRP